MLRITIDPAVPLARQIANIFSHRFHPLLMPKKLDPEIDARGVGGTGYDEAPTR